MVIPQERPPRWMVGFDLNQDIDCETRTPSESTVCRRWTEHARPQSQERGFRLPCSAEKKKL